MKRTVAFMGKSGKFYEYQIFDLWPSFKDEPGNYSFAVDNGSTIRPLYFGESGSLKNRVSDIHERYLCAKQSGANVVCAHLSSSDVSIRCAEERDLVDNYNPPCNRR